jgi:FdhE protein
MKFDDIALQQPHLKELLALYERTTEFLDRTVPLVREGWSAGVPAYPREVTRQVLGIFSELYAVPEATLGPLREALELNQIDLSRLPLREAPAFALPYLVDELESLLFLVGRPYFSVLRERSAAAGNRWDSGRCPVCSGAPALAAIESDESRLLFCPYCGARGAFRRTGCPICLEEDTSRITLLTVEGEAHLRIDACESCRFYLKTATGEGLRGRPFVPDLTDIVSIPLDIIAQSRGFIRSGPNPVGMLRMA